MIPRLVGYFKGSRRRKAGAAMLGAFLAYVLAGFFLLPPLLKWQLLKHLPPVTKRNAAVRQVEFNPLALSLTIRGLELIEPDGRRFAAWEELYINFQSSSLFRWAWTFKEIRLREPFGEIILSKDGGLNFANILEGSANAPDAAPSEGSGLPRVAIFHLQITNGVVVFEDQTRKNPFRLTHRPINIDLTGFATRLNTKSPYSLRAGSETGQSLTWDASISVLPLRSTGRLDITGIRLPRYQPYIDNLTGALLTNGVADIGLNYSFAVDANGVDIVVTNAGIQLEQARLVDPETGETAAGVERLRMRNGEFNWRKRGVQIGEVVVSQPAGLIRLQRDGMLNWLRLFKAASGDADAAKPAAKDSTPSAGAQMPFTVSLNEILIENGDVTFEDLTRSKPFRTEFKPIKMEFKHVSTRTNSLADYSFHLTTELSETIQGQGSFAVNPLQSSGELKAEAIQLKKYLPYSEGFFQGEITSGELGLVIPYNAAMFANQLQAGISNLNVVLGQLEVKAPGGNETIARVERLDLARGDASLEERAVHVGKVTLEGGNILARLKEDGALNLLDLAVSSPSNRAGGASPTPPTNPPVSPSPKTNAWKVTVAEVALGNYSIQLEDAQLGKTAGVLLNQMAFNVKGLSNTSNAPFDVSFSTRINETGSIAAQGQAQLAPISADFTFGLTNLEARPFQPWVSQHLNLVISNGAASTHGRVAYQSDAANAPKISFSGDFTFTNFLCLDELTSTELASWELFSASGIGISIEPIEVQVDEIHWTAPETTLVVQANGKVNFASILKSPQSSGRIADSNSAPRQPQTHAENQKPTNPFPVQVGLVRIEDASLAFVDRNIEPNARVGITELGGTIRGLSSSAEATADIDLSGRIDEQSPFSISGKINPLSTNLFVDLVVSNRNTQLSPLTPYMEKYGGYPLKRGRLTTTLRYRIEGKALKAENQIEIEQLTLGTRNNSPDATQLPVKLAVALLKDHNGTIDLNLPISGRLDDPQFKIGRVLLSILMDTLTKVAASPFKLLGSLVGGGGEELSFIMFQPGATNLAETEIGKLKKLAQALAKRPALNLEIQGEINPGADREALAAIKLQDRLKARHREELATGRKPPSPSPTSDISQEAYQQLLREAFAEQFGTNVSAILKTNNTLLAPTNQPGVSQNAADPKPPFYKRAIIWLGLDRSKEESKENQLPQPDRLALKEASPDLMEKLLAAEFPVTDEDYRALMLARARAVQEWLLNPGQIDRERLLLASPKAVDASYQGESRATLSVE